MGLENYKFCTGLVLLLSLSSIATMFTAMYHSSDLKEIRAKKNSALGIRQILSSREAARKERNPSSFGLGEASIFSDKYSPPEGDDAFRNLSIISFRYDTLSVRRGLTHSIANVEDDVLTFDTYDILKPLSNVTIEESSLVHKIQQKQRNADFNCVIRIAKYCSSRCDYLVKGKHSREWTPFRCELSEFCRFETRFIGNLTKEVMKTIDVVFFIPGFRDVRLKQVMAARPPGQFWVLCAKESPQHDPDYAPRGLTGNPFNLTMTYVRDSDIYFPYATVRKLGKPNENPPDIPKKTKLIAWMAFNCKPYYWKRTELAKAIQRNISVDMYGKCGTGRLAHDKAIETLEQYKFYFAFENSECRDYITEKVWKNCLSQGIVPIVYGSTREGYEKSLPRNSFISVEDFSNMSEFVDYIHALDKDDARYMEYFDWRRDGEVQFHSPSAFRGSRPELNFCYLVKKLIFVFVHPENTWQKRNPYFTSWWRRQCADHSVEKIVLGFNTHRSTEEQAIIDASMRRGDIEM
nr:alpha-(1,3)-fucosyltransferase C-like [Lytechinus pictus]